MQNMFREFAWRMLYSIEIILNKIHETLFFHQSATYWGHWSWPSRNTVLKWLNLKSINQTYHSLTKTGYWLGVCHGWPVGRNQSSLCDTPMSVCPSVRPSGRLSVCKQFLLPHLLWGFLSQRLLSNPSLLALWCSCATAILIMILSPGVPKGGVAIFTIYPVSLC